MWRAPIYLEGDTAYLAGDSHGHRSRNQPRGRGGERGERSKLERLLDIAVDGMGVDFVGEVDIGGLPYTKVARSIELLATEVLPWMRRFTPAHANKVP